MSTFILTLRKTTMKLLFRQTIPYINRRHVGGTRISRSSSSSDCTFSTDTTTTVDKFQEEVISILKEESRYVSMIDESIYHDTIIPKFKGGMLYKDIESGKDPNHKCHTWEFRSGIYYGIKGTCPSEQFQTRHTWRCKKCRVSRTFTNVYTLDHPVTLVQWLLEQDFKNGGCCCASSD